MSDINTNYIHHVTKQQYQDAIQFFLNGSVPQLLINNPKFRFKRRWKSAQLHNRNGKYRIFIQGKEVIPMNEIETVKKTIQ